MKKVLLCLTLIPFVICVSAQNDTKLVTICGHVVDSVLREDFPFAYIDVIQNDSIVVKTSTDLDGNFRLRIPSGEYLLQISAIGCFNSRMSIVVDKNTDLGTIVIKAKDPFFYDDPHIATHPPIIDIDPNGATQQIEVEQVKVIVR